MAKSKKSAKSPKAASSALTITQKQEGKLTPNQVAFNNLTAKIEKLRKALQRREAQLDAATKLYGTAIPPLEKQQADQSRQILELLMPVYRSGKMPQTYRAAFKAMLQDVLQTALDAETAGPDAALKAIFRELEGEDYDAVAKREEKEMREEMQEDMRRHSEAWGVDLDWAEDEPLSDEALAEKMHEFRERMAEKMEEERHHQNTYRTRPKTGKALEKEKKAQEAEALQQKNITVIYRQLVKLLHPDLERDEARRLEKEVLMKEVTEAYETKNLHALLMLELKWVHNENSHLETLTEEKLAVYLDILRQQARDLEIEKGQLIHHPRYHALVERYGYRPLAYPEKAVKEEISFLEEMIATGARDLQALAGLKPLPHVKQMVREWQDSQKNDDLDFLVEMLFAQRGFKE